MTNPQITKSGTKCWHNENGLFHRLDGPAIEYAYGRKEWWANGKRHRIGGPAVEWNDGRKEWWINDKRHREDGPAFVCCTGSEEWYVNGKYVDIKPILERLEISPDWKSWPEVEKMIVRLALP